MPWRHIAVKNSVGEYVREQAHRNGMESFRSMPKRGFTGTYHRISPKRLHRYVDEFQGWCINRPLDSECHLADMASGCGTRT